MVLRAKGALFLVSTALAIGLAACSSAAPPATALPVPSVDSAAAVQPTSAEANPTLPGQPTDVPTAPPVRVDQYATDPTTVDLASGRPTLVKFFAFW